ncbi:MAG: FkbM family methyltransferase [Anaerolineae bacterium]|nr:FkbM family methyltransferase [Anaerolineae bacterium]
MTAKNRLRQAANRLLKPLGLVILRTDEAQKFARYQREKDRLDLRGIVRQAAKVGFQPATVIDVGAAYGTPQLYETFPQAHHLLIEPLVEYQSALEKTKQDYAKMDIIFAAASDHTNGITIHVHPDLVGSSTYQEDESSNVNGMPRDVATVRLDRLCKERNLRAPYLIKVDVQGAELDVINGAEGILADTEFIVLEIALFEFYKGAPQFYDVIHAMKERGYVAYDFTEPLYRPLDDAVSQIDIAFVKENSRFREQQHYATDAQRSAQNKALMTTFERILEE